MRSSAEKKEIEKDGDIRSKSKREGQRGRWKSKVKTTGQNRTFPLRECATRRPQRIFYPPLSFSQRRRRRKRQGPSR